MILDWLVAASVPLAAGAATAVIARAAPQGSADWGQLAAATTIVIAAFSGVNAWFSRSTKLAIGREIDAAKREMNAHVDRNIKGLRDNVEGNIKALRDDLARKDVTDQRFRELERRVDRVDATERDEMRREWRRRQEDERGT